MATLKKIDPNVPIEESIAEDVATHVALLKPGIKIDWQFIGELEGSRTKGYVPDAGASNSGVTIASGLDIGQRDRAGLEALGLPREIVVKLAPYCGKRGSDAVALLAKKPLEIMSSEESVINKLVHAHFTEQLIGDYDGASKLRLEEIPREAQTVIASIQFQYGSIKKKQRKFWSHVVVQDWRGAIDELGKFGQRYKTRRCKEQERLREIFRLSPGATHRHFEMAPARL